MSTITTTPRRPVAPWLPVTALAVLLIGVLVASGARLTWDVPSVPVQVERTITGPSAVSMERAAQLAAARHERTAIRDVVRQTPSIRSAMGDRVQLLTAVGAGHVPVETLARTDHDPARLRAAVNGGHVPRESLDPRR